MDKQDKKILFLINKFKRGGAERQFSLQINGLNRRGYQVYLGILFDFKSRETFLEDLKISNTRIKIFGFKKTSD